MILRGLSCVSAIDRRWKTLYYTARNSDKIAYFQQVVLDKFITKFNLERKEEKEWLSCEENRGVSAEEDDIDVRLTTGPESATLAGVGREEVGVGLLMVHV